MKMKTIEVHSLTEALHLRKRLVDAANATRDELRSIVNSSDGPASLMKMKFEKVGHDPLDASRKLNLTEQINQSSTYLASFLAAVDIFTNHPSVQSLTLRLGTEAGTDIETADSEGVAAEVFASVNPSNNEKLKEDVAKVALHSARHKYVYFLCPRFKGRQKPLDGFNSVTIIALDFDQI